MQDWEFKGDYIGPTTSGISTLGGDVRYLGVWFKKDDSLGSRPVFCFGDDEDIEPMKFTIFIKKYEDGSLIYDSVTPCDDVIRVTLREDEYGLHAETIKRSSPVSYFFTSHYEATTETDGWSASMVGRIRKEKKTFQDPSELPEYWKRVFFRTHRRKI